MNRTNFGFTLIEIVAVLIILSVLAAVAVSRFSTSSIELVTHANALKAHIRYARLQAMSLTDRYDSSSGVWGIKKTNAGTRYWLHFNNGTQIKLALPGVEVDNNNRYNLPDGIIISFEPDTKFITFDSWGVPYDDKDASTLQVQDRSVTISNGSDSISFVIVKNTGYIQQ